MTTSQSFIRSLLPVLGLITVAVLGAGNASAANPSDTPRSVRVIFSDLDLTTTRGAKALYARLKRASRTVCGMDYMTPQENISSGVHNCYRQALAGAVAKVNNPMLAEVHGIATGAVKNRTLVSQRSGAQ